MDTKELLKKVRKIEIKTRRLSNHVFGGEYHSTFKGKGMTFSEVRNYQFGDDVRSIDWNVTARYNEPFVKVFEEERELTMMLLVDVSGSELFGSQKQFKKEIITEIAATLAFSATQNNDKLFKNQFCSFKSSRVFFRYTFAKKRGFLCFFAPLFSCRHSCCCAGIKSECIC